MTKDPVTVGPEKHEFLLQKRPMFSGHAERNIWDPYVSRLSGGYYGIAAEIPYYLRVTVGVLNVGAWICLDQKSHNKQQENCWIVWDQDQGRAYKSKSYKTTHSVTVG